MNTLGYFKGYEAEEKENLRGDKNEGLISTHDSNSTTVTWNGMNLPAVGTIKVSYADVEKINLYCLSAITGKNIFDSKNGEFYFSSRFEEFGERMIYIKRADLFFEKIMEAVRNDNNIAPFEKNILGRQVKYFNEDENHCDLGMFAKFFDYAWQQEFRLAFQRIEGEGAIKLYLGNLEDIVEVLDTKEAIKHSMKLVR